MGNTKVTTNETKKKIVYIILTLLFSAVIKSTFVFAGPIFGQLVDAKTGNPLTYTKIKLKIEVCPPNQFLNFGGCNPDIIYDKTVMSDINGKFTFPFKLIFKNPVTSIHRRQLSMNRIDKNNLVYFKELHYSYYGKGPYIDISGGITGYEGLDHEIKWIPFSYRKTSLIPLTQFMTADDCPQNLTEVDRRRCLDHVAIREAQPLAAITQRNGYTSKSSQVRDMIYRYYRTKYFSDCDKPQNYGVGMQTELGCHEIMKVVKENYPLCSAISESLEFEPDFQELLSNTIKTECELYHIAKSNQTDILIFFK
jgi:hypothetical protein